MGEPKFARPVSIIDSRGLRRGLDHGATLLLERETLDEAALLALRREMAPFDRPVAAQ